jgi:hypothetical protein
MDLKLAERTEAPLDLCDRCYVRATVKMPDGSRYCANHAMRELESLGLCESCEASPGLWTEDGIVLCGSCVLGGLLA